MAMGTITRRIESLERRLGALTPPDEDGAGLEVSDEEIERRLTIITEATGIDLMPTLRRCAEARGEQEERAALQACTPRELSMLLVLYDDLPERTLEDLTYGFGAQEKDALMARCDWRNAP